MGGEPLIEKQAPSLMRNGTLIEKHVQTTQHDEDKIALSRAIQRDEAAAEAIAMVRDDCERKIAEAKAEAEMRAATAEEAAAAATMRAIDIETANAEKRIAEVRAALADRISAAEESAAKHAKMLEEESMAMGRRMEELRARAEADAAHRIRLVEAECEQRIAAAEAAAEQRATAAENAAAKAAQRAAEVEADDAAECIAEAEKRVARAEAVAAQHALGMHAALAAASVAVVGATDEALGAHLDSVGVVAHLSGLGDGSGTQSGRVKLRLRVLLDLCESVGSSVGLRGEGELPGEGSATVSRFEAAAGAASQLDGEEAAAVSKALHAVRCRMLEEPDTLYDDDEFAQTCAEIMRIGRTCASAGSASEDEDRDADGDGSSGDDADDRAHYQSYTPPPS